MFETVFSNPAQRCKGNSDFWKVLIIATVIIVVGVYVVSDGTYIAFGPGPLLILIIWRLTRNKVEGITLYVNRKGPDFEFGYKDSNNEQKGPYPIDEYTYWCYEGTSTGNGWNYELYLQINSRNATVYFKEKLVARNPPAGWQRTPQQIKDAEGVFYVPQLIQLAAMIDQATPGSATPASVAEHKG